MATLYSRLIHYSQTNNKELLNHYHRSCLGNIVSEKFKQTRDTYLPKVKSIEEGVICKAMDYRPDFFIEIDKLIDQYYKEHFPQVKKKRPLISSKDFK